MAPVFLPHEAMQGQPSFMDHISQGIKTYGMIEAIKESRATAELAKTRTLAEIAKEERENRERKIRGEAMAEEFRQKGAPDHIINFVQNDPDHANEFFTAQAHMEKSMSEERRKKAFELAAKHPNDIGLVARVLREDGSPESFEVSGIIAENLTKWMGIEKAEREMMLTDAEGYSRVIKSGNYTPDWVMDSHQKLAAKYGEDYLSQIPEDAVNDPKKLAGAILAMSRSVQDQFESVDKEQNRMLRQQEIETSRQSLKVSQRNATVNERQQNLAEQKYEEERNMVDVQYDQDIDDNVYGLPKKVKKGEQPEPILTGIKGQPKFDPKSEAATKMPDVAKTQFQFVLDNMQQIHKFMAGENIVTVTMEKQIPEAISAAFKSNYQTGKRLLEKHPDLFKSWDDFGMPDPNEMISRLIQEVRAETDKKGRPLYASRDEQDREIERRARNLGVLFD
jgi:hypothetical protein